MDPASALIWSPPHFTWMDTNFPACTPREGYPVEIQALWIRLLRQLDRLGDKPSGEPWRVLADRAEESLKKLFWLEEPGYMADVLIARPGQAAAAAVPDNALRSNYLWAIAFGFVTGAPARRAVAAALRYLFVPGALRSLAPLPVWPPLEIRRADGQLLGQPREPYQGRYEGDEDTRRKPAYHNGTAWTWTLPMACEALALAWDSAARRRRRRPGLSGRDGPSDDGRLPGPVAGNSGWRRSPSAARLRRPGLERAGSAAGLAMVASVVDAPPSARSTSSTPAQTRCRRAGAPERPC